MRGCENVRVCRWMGRWVLACVGGWVGASVGRWMDVRVLRAPVRAQGVTTPVIFVKGFPHFLDSIKIIWVAVSGFVEANTLSAFYQYPLFFIIYIGAV